MAVRIRMSVHGRCNRRIFHINAVEGGRRRDARPAELLGIYDPYVPVGGNTKTIQWSVDRIRYWLSVGATPSRSVVKLLELGGILKAGSPFHTHSAKEALKLKKSSPTLKALEEVKAAKQPQTSS